MTEKDVNRMTQALVALQQQYVDLVEDESADSDECATFYLELCKEIQEKVQLTQKYARLLLISEHFLEAFTTLHGKLEIYASLPITKLSESYFYSHFVHSTSGNISSMRSES